MLPPAPAAVVLAAVVLAGVGACEAGAGAWVVNTGGGAVAIWLTGDTLVCAGLEEGLDMAGARLDEDPAAGLATVLVGAVATEPVPAPTAVPREGVALQVALRLAVKL